MALFCTLGTSHPDGPVLHSWYSPIQLTLFYTLNILHPGGPVLLSETFENQLSMKGILEHQKLLHISSTYRCLFCNIYIRPLSSVQNLYGVLVKTCMFALC